jgi:hypothetical protein
MKINVSKYLFSVIFLAAAFGSPPSALAQINVITVDCTPFVSPGAGSFGPTNTMGMALQVVDQGSDFNVTELTPMAFRNLTAQQLATFDLIAINNHPARLGDGCIAGAGGGIGTTWQGVVGVNSGGRVVLTSHDAPRFKLQRTPPAPPLFTGFEPFGTFGLVRQAALWAGGVPGKTGFLVFNDSARFFTVGGVGWNNAELNLPPAWGITDLDQSGGNFMNGGYTDILAAFQTHPIYDGTAVGGVVLSDTRFAMDSISSFSANVSDTSFHSIFATFNPLILSPTEVVINAGVVDVLNLCFCSGAAAPGPDGTAITLIRDADEPPEVACVETVNPHGENVPRAGQKSKGQNEDGFYQLLAVDDNDPDPQIFVSDVNGSGPFGPFSSGDNVKITEAPGSTPGSKSMGSGNGQAGAIAAHIKLTGDAVVTAVDAAGNTASASCLVPPPPK